MNVQVMADPAGRLIWASHALPGARHYMGAAREHGLLDALRATGITVIADNGYRGAGFEVPQRRRPRDPDTGRRRLSRNQRDVNAAHARHRGPGERANARLKSWKILRKIRCCPAEPPPSSRPSSPSSTSADHKGSLQIERDHQEVDELVARLDSSSTKGSGQSELLCRTFAVLDHDVRTEEDDLLPRLQQVLSPRQLRFLGLRWELVRRISPTRPHPVVSRRPPGQTLSALPLTMLDRSRDRLQQLDELTHHRLTRPLSTLDWILAAAAGWVERLPVMQRGERPDTSR
jgi:hypothetical protein